MQSTMNTWRLKPYNKCVGFCGDFPCQKLKNSKDKTVEDISFGQIQRVRNWHDVLEILLG